MTPETTRPTCDATNCQDPHYHGVTGCEAPAVATYTIRPGVVLNICAHARARMLRDPRCAAKVRAL